MVGVCAGWLRGWLGRDESENIADYKGEVERKVALCEMKVYVGEPKPGYAYVRAQIAAQLELGDRGADGSVPTTRQNTNHMPPLPLVRVLTQPEPFLRP